MGTGTWAEAKAGEKDAAVQKILTAFGELGLSIIESINKDQTGCLTADIARFAFRRAYALTMANSSLIESEEQKRARGIMGENFLGIPEAVRYGGMDPTTVSGMAHANRLLRTSKFDESLLETSKNDHILVYVPSLSVNEIVERNNAGPKLTGRNLLNSRNVPEDSPHFVSPHEREAGWWLVKKNPAPDSDEKTMAMQKSLLKRGENFVTGPVLLYTITTYFLITKQKLLTDDQTIRCNTGDDDGRLVVGPFKNDRIEVALMVDQGRRWKNLYCLSMRRPFKT